MYIFQRILESLSFPCRCVCLTALSCKLRSITQPWKDKIKWTNRAARSLSPLLFVLFIRKYFHSVDTNDAIAQHEYIHMGETICTAFLSCLVDAIKLIELINLWSCDQPVPRAQNTKPTPLTPDNAFVCAAVSIVNLIVGFMIILSLVKVKKMHTCNSCSKT